MRTCLRKIGILAAAILLAALCTIGCKTEVSDETFTVEVTAGEHGTVNANPASGKVTQGTVITFTALPETDYKVDTWTITGGSFEEGGTTGSPTADVTISADTKVNVSFTPATYAEVPFGANGANLDNHLKNTQPDINGIYYIKVTGLTAANLKGKSSYPYEPSALGKILNDNPTKKVVLKLGEISGLTDMSWCFSGCISLTQAPVIPSGVTNMDSCFSRCESLTQAPVIPAGVTNMFSCFSGCESLTQAPVIPASVTIMSYCFSGCESLTQAPVIPAGVAGMSSCFSGCESLTQAPVIPNSVIYMSYCFSGCKNITAVTLKCNYNVGKFDQAFSGCKKLTARSIKVPSSELERYKGTAPIMGTQRNRFIADE